MYLFMYVMCERSLEKQSILGLVLTDRLTLDIFVAEHVTKVTVNCSNQLYCITVEVCGCYTCTNLGEALPWSVTHSQTSGAQSWHLFLLVCISCWHESVQWLSGWCGVHDQKEFVHWLRCVCAPM